MTDAFDLWLTCIVVHRTHSLEVASFVGTNTNVCSSNSSTNFLINHPSVGQLISHCDGWQCFFAIAAIVLVLARALLMRIHGRVWSTMLLRHLCVRQI